MGEHNKTGNFVLIDSRSRSGGTPWQYRVNLPSTMTGVSCARMCWITFFNGSTNAPADVFWSTPYVSLHVDELEGTHRFSTGERASSALAVIPRNLDNNTYTFYNSSVGCNLSVMMSSISKLQVSFRDSNGDLLQSSAMEHAFMLEIITQPTFSNV